MPIKKHLIAQTTLHYGDRSYLLMLYSDNVLRIVRGIAHAHYFRFNPVNCQRYQLTWRQVERLYRPLENLWDSEYAAQFIEAHDMQQRIRPCDDSALSLSEN